MRAASGGGLRLRSFSVASRKSGSLWQRERLALTAWLESLKKPVGALTCNDGCGRQVIETCSIGGIHVPNDVAVVGVDEDHLLSEFSNPPLSSVMLNTEQGGYQAAEMLDQMMRKRVTRQQVILVRMREGSCPSLLRRRRHRGPGRGRCRDVHPRQRSATDRSAGCRDVFGNFTPGVGIPFPAQSGRSIREEIQRIRVWIGSSSYWWKPTCRCDGVTRVVGHPARPAPRAAALGERPQMTGGRGAGRHYFLGYFL